MNIDDGSGRGYRAKVDQYNRLDTYSTTIPEASDVSVRTERAFSVSSDVLTFNSTNEHPFLLIKNMSTDLLLYFSSIQYSFNGGNSGGDKSIFKRVYRNVPDPISNFEEMTPQNLNFGSLKSPDCDVYMWDGSSSDGMVVDTSSKKSLSTTVIGKGGLVLSDIESIVLDVNSSLLVSLQPEEIGKAAISLKFYFNHQNCCI